MDNRAFGFVLEVFGLMPKCVREDQVIMATQIAELRDHWTMDRDETEALEEGVERRDIREADEQLLGGHGFELGAFIERKSFK